MNTTYTIAKKQPSERDVQRFIARMLPHLLAGKDLKAAGEAVLKRDRELLEDVRNNKQLRDALCEQVYHALRA